MKEVLISVCTMIGIVTPIIWKLYNDLKSSKRKHDDLKKRYQSSSFNIDFKNLNLMKDVINNVFRDTHMDRFILLSSVNKKDPVNFVSALYEQHKLNETCKLSFGATSKYIDITTDTDYKKMLRRIENVEPCYYRTASMNHCMLKNIYLNEKIKHSSVYFLGRVPIDKDNDRFVFCSFSTHQDKEITEYDQIVVEGSVQKIKDYLF